MPWIFDALIYGFLAVGAVLIGILVHELHDLIRDHRKPHHHRLVLSIAIAVAVAAWFTVAYGSFIEPRTVVVRSDSISIGERPTNRLRFAVISDLHAGPNLPASTVTRVVERMKNLDPKPDAVLIAGDFVGSQNRAATALEALGQTGIPTYGVLGNHDYLDDGIALQAMLESFGIHVLRNESHHFATEHGTLAVVGLDDIWFGKPDFDRALENVPANTPTLLLAHNPDVVLGLGTHQFGAVVAGHTHGGQIRLPFVGPMAPIPTILGRSYDRGQFDWHGTPLVITSGVGTTGPRARLFVPPEVLVLEVNF